MSGRKMTIGMLTYDDFDGVYFSIQSLRMHHPEILSDIDLLVIDNNPDGKHGQEVKNFIDWIKDVPVRYIPLSDTKGTALRDRVFTLAETPFVLCMDCHVMFPPGSIRRLIDFMDSGRDERNLLQGPMLYDNLEIGATHMDVVWRDGMLGTWAIDDRALNSEADPFEIPAHGLGIFACRKDAWLGFNPKFRGFGGEECYIHEKFRRSGKKTLCLPFLRWMHRFQRPDGIPYAPIWEDRVWNYLIGHKELGMDTTMIIYHFASKIPAINMESLVKEASIDS